MELRDYIEAGIAKKSGRDGLADYLGLHPNHITNAKAHARGIPDDACIKLADLIGADRIAVIAASNLATERKAEKREFWQQIVRNQPSFAKAAGIALFFTIVTNFVTPSPANAAPALAQHAERICIM